MISPRPPASTSSEVLSTAPRDPRKMPRPQLKGCPVQSPRLAGRAAIRVSRQDGAPVTAKPIPDNGTPVPESLDDYIAGLVALAQTQDPDAEARVLAALDGEVSRHIRAVVPLSVRRSEGAFFTSQELANRLVARDARLF